MASPSDPALISAIARQVERRGRDWFDGLKDRAADKLGLGLVLTSQGFADGGSHSGQIDMAPSDLLALFENVDRHLDGTATGGAVRQDYSKMASFG